MKLFTVEEANALLPSVRQLLKRLKRFRHRLSAYKAEARQAAEQADQGGGGISGGLLYARLLTNFAGEMSRRAESGG